MTACDPLLQLRVAGSDTSLPRSEPAARAEAGAGRAAGRRQGARWERRGRVRRYVPLLAVRGSRPRPGAVLQRSDARGDLRCALTIATPQSGHLWLGQNSMIWSVLFLIDRLDLRIGTVLAFL